MKELSTEEIQQCCLRILEYFDQFAKKNHLTYYLSGGTLLGAVRHKGFIPWDDDVDLMMPRPDYEKLLNIFHSDKYRLSDCDRDEEYCSSYARMWDPSTILIWNKARAHEKQLGCFIDIFPIDGFPENELMTKLHLCRAKIANAKVSMAVKEGYAETEKYVPVKKMLKGFFRKDANFYARNLNQLAQTYDFNSCSYAGVYGASIPHIFREKNEKSVYAKTVMLDFEHLKLPAPVGYDIYLKRLYGSYMELPPEDKRISIHNFRIYWRK